MPNLNERIHATLGAGAATPVTTLLDWADWQLESAEVGIRLHGHTKPDGDANVLGVRFHAIEIAALNLVFRCITTALDLCAATMFRINYGQPRGQREWDLDGWFASQAATKLSGLPADQRQWLRSTQQASEWKILRECRHGITHRSLSRDIVQTIGSRPTGATKVNVLGTAHEIEVLMPRLLEYGQARSSVFVELLERLF